MLYDFHPKDSACTTAKEYYTRMIQHDVISDPYNYENVKIRNKNILFRTRRSIKIQKI